MGIRILSAVEIAVIGIGIAGKDTRCRDIYVVEGKITEEPGCQSGRAAVASFSQNTG